MFDVTFLLSEREEYREQTMKVSRGVYSKLEQTIQK